MKKELEDEETSQPRPFFFNFTDWAPYVDVSSETIANLCKCIESICAFQDPRVKTYLSTILYRVLRRKAWFISNADRGTGAPRALTYQGHDGEKIVPLIRQNTSAPSSYMRLCKAG